MAKLRAEAWLGETLAAGLFLVGVGQICLGVPVLGGASLVGSLLAALFWRYISNRSLVGIACLWLEYKREGASEN